MASIAVLIGGAVAGDLSQPHYQINIALAMLSAFIITGAGNTINDYYDIDIDKVNAPTRPIPSGEIKQNTAHKLSIALFIVGVALSIFINVVCLVIATINSLLLYFYARNLKGTPLIGNLSVGILVGTTFLYGGAAVEGLAIATILFILATTATIGREIAKDIEDIKGDRGVADTVATKYGINNSANLAIAMTVIAVSMSPLPYTLEIFGIEYLATVMIANIIFITAAIQLLKEKTIKSASKFQKNSKTAMITALISFLIGSLL
ncbi:4-hydroxybenzoate polyprenyltransferase family prenyltransferase UbiA [Methanonatronarchaeum thermophilum]|uniref:4-hydroxybenzoate polyprenyltransferase family prenyltransferase UbiA n=1 Tax=Methanonatronarchaeum thermophilum TaxID=1927129 RepID=A0A1Y3G9U1_9EURY|nr:UbiA family prenyltransferase [Methanonatronarchaeum thermophilum]OUJ18201.1 4-hydroxybenzoate polyprenyltransferase family prenyltransferase UbiA [Methanonatronarchaeum thermophilum]